MKAFAELAGTLRGAVKMLEHDMARPWSLGSPHGFASYYWLSRFWHDSAIAMVFFKQSNREWLSDRDSGDDWFGSR